MKTKKEVEKLANAYSKIGKDAGSPHRETVLEKIAFEKGYLRCQMDDIEEINRWQKAIKQQKLKIDSLKVMISDLKTTNSEVTRLEVIDEKGRVYTRHDCNIELSYQDNDKTLKVFIKPNTKSNEST